MVEVLGLRVQDLGPRDRGFGFRVYGVQELHGFLGFGCKVAEGTFRILGARAQGSKVYAESCDLNLGPAYQVYKATPCREP